MSVDPGAAWDGMVDSAVFAIALTLAAYEGARRLWVRSGRQPLLNPVLVSIAVIGTVLWVTDVDYDSYAEGSAVITLLLGPATVALAWPMHRELRRLREAVLPVLASVVLATGAAVVTAYVVTHLAGGPQELALSMTPKTTTTPVAIALTTEIGGVPALTAVLTVLTGVLGASLGPPLLDALRVRDPRVRGLAVGASAHGIGTAAVMHEGRTVTAFAGLAMALATLATSVWVPLLVPLLG
jgi:predicted murein hydrolase (TIGR00659 family)